MLTNPRFSVLWLIAAEKASLPAPVSPHGQSRQTPATTRARALARRSPSARQELLDSTRISSPPEASREWVLENTGLEAILGFKKAVLFLLFSFAALRDVHLVYLLDRFLYDTCILFFWPGKGEGVIS